MIYATTLPYTVPVPRGKAQAVSGDGRLHALYIEAVATPSDDYPDVVITYTINPGRIEFHTGNGGATVPVEGGTVRLCLTSEPSTQVFAGGVVGNPQDIIVGGGGGGFAWLPAGSVVSVAIGASHGAGTISVVGCLVEDYGQLAEGDEYGVGSHSEPPAFLIAGES